MLSRRLLMVTTAAACFTLDIALAGMASAACVQIKTPADLNKIRSNLAGDFCLADDIDMQGVANYQPIGLDRDHAFTGTFDGRGHIIRNLTISSGATFVGLFGYSNGTLKNVGVVAAEIKGTANGYVGALAGVSFGTVMGAYSTGSVSVTLATNDGTDLMVGGLIGIAGGTVAQSHSGASVSESAPVGSFDPKPTIGGLIGAGGAFTDFFVMSSYATGSVSAPDSAYAGGLLGRALFPNSSSLISHSFATGEVTAGNGDTGGLIGLSESLTITGSFAAGAVVKTTTGASTAGGLVGSLQDSSVLQSYATGQVRVTNQVSGATYAGGLLGLWNGGKLEQDLAFGRVSASGSNVGGFVGYIANSGAEAATNYFDTETTRRPVTNMAASGRTTAQLQAKLPAGLARTVWAITPKVTYPYFRSGAFVFQATLATLVRAGPPTTDPSEIFTFLPISQLEPAEYSQPATYKSKASRAAVFTVIARAIGTTRDSAALADATIDQFWSMSAGAAKWQGPVTKQASLGSFIVIPAGQQLGDANVLPPLRSDKLVILRGSYMAGSGRKTHWMLGTSFVSDGSGAVTAIVADDPLTGSQVRIDPASKTVASPAGFPLAGFTVDGYQTVTIKPIPTPGRLAAR